MYLRYLPSPFVIWTLPIYIFSYTGETERAKSATEQLEEHSDNLFFIFIFYNWGCHEGMKELNILEVSQHEASLQKGQEERPQKLEAWSCKDFFFLIFSNRVDSMILCRFCHLAHFDNLILRYKLFHISSISNFPLLSSWKVHFFSVENLRNRYKAQSIWTWGNGQIA